MMVPGANERISNQGLHPLQVEDGQPVTLQNEHRFIKGVVRIHEANDPSFILEPRLDLYDQPMGKPVEVTWAEMAGEGATVKLFPRA